MKVTGCRFGSEYGVSLALALDGTWEGFLRCAV